MAVSPEFRIWLEDALGRVQPVRTRAMFGGLGVYAGDLFFALSDGETLYMKGDRETHAAYEAAGSHRFQPYGPDGAGMDYWTVPAEVMEDPGELRVWVDRALEVALRARKGKRAKKGKRVSGPGDPPS